MMTIEEAKAIMKRGLGKAELELVTSFTAPLYWIIRTHDGKFTVRNGSTFFLDAGEGPFGVTAAHVIEGWRTDCATATVVACQLGTSLQVDFDGKNQLIDKHDGLDIATFRITTSEINSINKVILTGHQKAWPPPPPEQGKGIYFSGFPSVGNKWVSSTEISLGAAPGGGVASSVSQFDVSSLVERERMLDVMGLGLPSENFDFGGISGGPMLTVVEHHRIRSWRLAGVIYEGPNPSVGASDAIPGLEIIRARRADFILPTGKLDLQRWQSLNL
jgi:hypothetical protein